MHYPELDAPTCRSTHGDRTLRRFADELLPDHRVEYFDDGFLFVTAIPGFGHAEILRLIVEQFTCRQPSQWSLRNEDFQFDLVENLMKVFVPDPAVAYPGSTSDREFRKYLALVVEVTSPDCPKSERNDRTIKRKKYAKNGVPCYLLVDQAERSWTVHVLEGEWPGHRVHSHGRYGEAIKLPEPFGFAIPTDEWPPYTDEG